LEGLPGSKSIVNRVADHFLQLRTPAPTKEAQALIKRYYFDYSQIAVQLDPLDDVLDVFPEQVSTELVYIFVQVPHFTSQQRPKYLSKEKMSTEAFFNQCRPRMEELLNNAGNVPSVIPSWELSYSADQKLVDHISKLRIPRVANGRPSLLLHNLGEDKNNSEVARVFSSGMHRCVASHIRICSSPIFSLSQRTSQHLRIRQNSASPRGFVSLLGFLFCHEAG
jgi:hypothetical protein